MGNKVPVQNPVIPKTISESIHNHLKEDIINNRLKANQKITEVQIAKLFGVSITPVRDALLKLDAEGYIHINSSRRISIKCTSYKELSDIFKVLAHLDAMAMDLIVDNVKNKDLMSIEKMTSKLEKYCNSESIEKYIEINYLIHRSFWKFVPNVFLQSTLNRVLDQVFRYKYSRIKAYKKPGVLENSLNDHKKILELLKSKKKNELITLITNHWGTSAYKEHSSQERNLRKNSQ